jgi:membrane protease subunit (stomatin/prohibitin family)
MAMGKAMSDAIQNNSGASSGATSPEHAATATATKFCAECGQSIPRASKFCPECGKPQA